MVNLEIPDGVYAAALTPIGDDYSCDWKELIAHCKELIARGCQGVVICGTTGEAPSFSVQEKIGIFEKIAASEIDSSKVIATNGGANIPDTVLFARALIEHRFPALLIAPPTFFKHVPEEGVIAYYRHVIEQIGDARLKILLYHIPQCTGVPITLKIAQILQSEFPEVVVGLKESEGNSALTKAVIDAIAGFKVFVGKETEIIEAVQYGAAGAICGLANLYPELICSLFVQGKKGHCNNPDELATFFHALDRLPFISAFKAVMEKRKGKSWHRLRPPLLPLSETEKREFFSRLKNEMR